MNSRAEIMKDILALAREDLQHNGDMGYTMPDGKHHIYIYADQEERWDDQPGDSFYVIEPNRVVNGAHDPMGDTYITSKRDLSDVLIGCQWCLDWFDLDREISHRVGEPLPDELIVRLAHEAGWMEAEGKIEVHSWEDIQAAIRDAISEYYENPSERNPFTIEETIERILLERFPSEPEPIQKVEKEIHILACTQESTYGIGVSVSLHPSSEDALRFANELREDEEYDPRTWNFELSSQIIDVSQFPDKSILDQVLSQAAASHLTNPQPSIQKKMPLTDKIQAAQEKQMPQTSLAQQPPKSITR